MAFLLSITFNNQEHLYKEGVIFVPWEYTARNTCTYISLNNPPPPQQFRSARIAFLMICVYDPKPKLLACTLIMAVKLFEAQCEHLTKGPT
jgi:hypothetical protein